MERTHRRHVAAWAGAALLGVSIVAMIATGSAGAAGTATMTASPQNGLTDLQTVTLTLTTTTPTESGVFIAITQCANADSSGAPLASYGVTTTCVNGEGLGNGTLVMLNFPDGAVTAGAKTITLKAAKRNDIGPAHGRCVAVPPGTLPCVIRVQTVKGADPYTGPGYSFLTDVPVTYAANAATTTTTAASGSTTTTTTAASGSTTTTTTAGSGSSTTTTTAASGSTTTTTARATTTTTVAGGAIGTSGGGSSSGGGNIIILGNGATVGTTAAATTATTVVGRTLAFTGPNRQTGWLLVLGLGLVDLGYLAVSSTWTSKLRPAYRRS